MTALTERTRAWTWRHWTVAAILAATAVLLLWITGSFAWYHLSGQAAMSDAWANCFDSFSIDGALELSDAGTSPGEICDQKEAEDPEGFLATYGD